GQTDLIARGNVLMVAIIERNPKRIPALIGKLKDSPVYVGVKKGQPELLGKEDENLNAAKADISLEKATHTWLKQQLPPEL
ncbi:amino acid ABC transporter substrate-binding protein, partial [Pseudomonas syringae pv. tagetis]